MYLGRVVEIGRTEEIFADPKHPYTKALLSAIPDPDPERSLPRELPRGEIPDAARPPAGCAFHPRCPRAFEDCGWEAKDLLTLLEEHWARVGVDDYDAERGVVGDVDQLAESGSTAVLKPGGGSSVADVRALLDRLRSDTGDDPFWRGVASIDEAENGVVIRFNGGRDPVLQPADGVEVACHLFD